MKRNLRAIAFFHAWGSDRKLQSPYHRIVESFLEQGVDLEIIFTNDLLGHSGDIHSINSLLVKQRLIRHIERSNPDFVLSINNGGLPRDVRNQIRVPVVKWLFDDFPHLFFHDGLASLNQSFHPEDFVFCYSHKLSVEIKSRYPFLEGRTFFLPHATDPNHEEDDSLKQDLPVSFVGSVLDYSSAQRYLARVSKLSVSHLNELLKLFNALEDDYYCDFESLTKSSIINEVLIENNSNWLHLKRHASDLISTKSRIDGLRAVDSFGLSIFGNPEWLKALLLHGKLLHSFKHEVQVDTQAKLLSVYNRSKISIDLPNVQNQTSLSGRVIDVMGSRSLLITKFHHDSDAFRLFGSDCPIPMYRDLAHLRELCEHFLNNESARIDVVRRCNALVKEEFDFSSRINVILGHLSLESSQCALPARVEFTSTNRFINKLDRDYLIPAGINLMIRALRLIVPKPLRSYCMTTLRSWVGTTGTVA